MNALDSVIVAAALVVASLYLTRHWRREWRAQRGSGCGCGNTGCKVPKPRIQKKDVA